MAIEIKERWLCYLFPATMSLKGAEELIFLIHGAWFLTHLLIQALFIHQSLAYFVILTLHLTPSPSEIIICPL